jgi:large subunit ribosomal protein L10
MKREQKEQVVEEIAAQIADAEAIYAADYRGLSVPQAAALRARLREVDASFRIVKNTLTLRAADKAGAEQVKELVEGPTAFAFVRGDAALAAKALDSFSRQENVLELRGGVLAGELMEAEMVRRIARLPAREQLNAQFAGVVAAPLTGLVRGLGSLLSGLAIALAQVRDQRGDEAVPDEAGAAATGAEPAEAETPAAEGDGAAAEGKPAAEAEPAAEGEEPPADEAEGSATEEAPAAESEPPAEETAADANDGPESQPGDEGPAEGAEGEPEPDESEPEEKEAG